MKNDRSPVDQIKKWPRGERPREKLIALGPERLSDADLLAILLRTGRGTFRKGVRGETAATLARSLLGRFRGLRGLDRADIPTLLGVEGLGIAKVAQLKAALELGKRLRRVEARPRTFDSSQDVANYLAPRYRNARNELVIALFLDGQNRLIEELVMSEGTPTQTNLHVRSVAEGALRASASTIVVAHNHPSGLAQPTPEDDETTRNLIQACKILGLVFLDHVILGDEDHYSFADSGRLDELGEA